MSRARKIDPQTAVLGTLQDLLIFHLTSAGVPQQKIREFLGIEIARVNTLAKLLKKSKKKPQEG